MPRFLERLPADRFETSSYPGNGGGALCENRCEASSGPPSRPPTTWRVRLRSRPGSKIDKTLVGFSGATPTTPPLRENDLPERKSGPFPR